MSQNAMNYQNDISHLEDNSGTWPDTSYSHQCMETGKVATVSLKERRRGRRQRRRGRGSEGGEGEEEKEEHLVVDLTREINRDQ